MLAVAALAATLAFFAPPSTAGDAPSGDLVALARSYEHGEGVAKNLEKAIDLYCEAAKRGDAEAQYSLGWMYANGRGVLRDDGFAGALFRMSADAGHEGAKKALQYFRSADGQLPWCMMPPVPDERPPNVVVGPDLPIESTTLDDLAPWKRDIAEQVRTLAPKFLIHPRLALAVISVESNFDPAARSPKDAGGLMQLMPDTAARFKVRDRFRIHDNLQGGLAYLQWLLAYYRGDVTLAVAAYNAGEKAVDRYRGVPPYPETQTYVQKIRALFRRERHPFDATVADPSPIIAPPLIAGQ